MDRDEAERRTGRRRLAGAGLCALAAGLIAGLWSQRAPIAAHFVDRALAAKGVQARYRITRFGTAGQRLEDIAIGDPAHPDLVARWAELRMSLGLNGVELRGIAAGGVRLRGRIADGRLALGSIDKLLPPPSGKPFSLPDIELTLRDAQAALATPLGPMTLALDGSGRLTDGFAGKLAAHAPALASGGCLAAAPTARLTVAIRRGQPLLTGPLSAASLVCGGARISTALLQLDAEASPTLDRWTGTARFATGRVAARGGRADRVAGTIGFDLAKGRSQGPLALTANGLALRGGGADRLAFDGRYQLDAGAAASGITGVATLAGGHADRAARHRLTQGLATSGGETPATPLFQALGRALANASADVGGRAQLTLAQDRDDGSLLVSRADLASRSGARLSFIGNDGLGWTWGKRRDAVATGGLATLSGGGLPSAQLAFGHTPQGAGGAVQLAAFAAGTARSAAVRVRFDIARDRAILLSARPMLDGPLGSGRVERLTLPIAARLGADGALAINPRCAELGFATLAIAGIVLTGGRVPLCPLGAALLTRSPAGALAGGGTIADLRVRGRIGAAPLLLTAVALRVPVRDPGFTADRLAIRLGTGGDPTRLDLASLDGRFVAGGIAGRFAGADGKIGQVPLLVSDGGGGWRLIDGRLILDGALRMSDAEQSAPRFKPLRADDFALRLVDGRIGATATLREPVSGTRVSDAVIRHDLRDGSGEAVLTVPGLAFTAGFQPDAVTPLTLGLVADVRGSLAGEGHVRWDAHGTTSDGVFRTDAMDLAAPFGPVKGIATTLRFDDLLGLHSPPGQIATVKEINPGIAVTDGVVHYQLAGSERVAIEDARWPFAGGALALEPATLDFGKDAERRLTFRVDGMDAARFVQQFEFDNVAVTGTFDGVVPMVFGPNGGRIEGGRLSVRPGGGTLAYVGELSNAQLGRFGKLAFDALKSMRYSNLTIALDGSLDGEVVSQVLFDGTNQTPKEAASRGGLLRQFANLPFRFRITVRAPFRGLLNSAESLNDPRGLIARSLARDPAAVQP